MKTAFLVGCLLAAAITSAAQGRIVSELTGLNLGRKPLGATPEVFALGVVSRDGIQMKLTMSADGAEILYTERDPATNAVSFISRHKAGDSWGEPIVLPFAREYMDIEPGLSPDGRTLLMHSRREGGFGNWDLYVSFKDESGGWSEFKNLGPAVNTDKPESSPTFSADGRFIFFTRETDIFWVSATIIEKLKANEK